MTIAGKYSFKNGEEVLIEQFPKELAEIQTIIKSVDALKCKTKISKEITMTNKLLYSPKDLNANFKKAFFDLNWMRKKEYCKYPYNYYTTSYQPNPNAKKKSSRPFREMDYVKNLVGVEVQFGKYAFMVYNVCAKMTIFRKLGHINVGVEIVPIKQFADEMSTGVSYFEQIVWDLETRGTADIDTPVLVLGVDT